MLGLPVAVFPLFAFTFLPSACLPPLYTMIYPTVGRGSSFLDPTQPTHKRSVSDPTLLDPSRNRLTWNCVPDPTRPIYARLLVFPWAAESFSLSTKRLNSHLRCQHHRFTCHCKQHVLNVGIKLNGNKWQCYSFFAVGYSNLSNIRFLACTLYT